MRFAPNRRRASLKGGSERGGSSQHRAIDLVRIRGEVAGWRCDDFGRHKNRNDGNGVAGFVKVFKIERVIPDLVNGFTSKDLFPDR